MIDAAQPSGGYALLQRLSDASGATRRQLDTAQQQVATGRVATSYAGLGAGARTTRDLRPQIQHQQVWQTNIDTAAGRLDATQSALRSVAGIAADFYARTNNLNQLGVSEADAIAASARSALQQVGQLLNTRVGDVYVFAGQDSANPPVPDTSPGVLATALLASDTATPPFSTTLGTALPEVEVGEGQRVATGVLANRNTLATSAAPTTGSYMRDVMRALATLTTVTGGPGTEAVAADTRSRLNSAISAMASETGSLGDIQSNLTARKAGLVDLSTALTKQVSAVEDVDLAAALTRVSALQTQLQASYQLIAGAKDLSLAKFLPA